MEIFDITDNYVNNLKTREDDIQNIEQYNNGLKEHTQPLVMFTNNGENVIYREQL